MYRGNSRGVCCSHAYGSRGLALRLLVLNGCYGFHGSLWVVKLERMVGKFVDYGVSRENIRAMRQTSN